MYPRTIIDSLSAVPNRDQLTHKDLHAHFSTGQSILLSGSGRDKKYGYRNGIQTDLGDIRKDVWLDLVRALIVRSHEEDLFDKLLEWDKEHTYWGPRDHREMPAAEFRIPDRNHGIVRVELAVAAFEGV